MPSTKECIAWRELVDRKLNPTASATQKSLVVARRKKEWQETLAADWQIVDHTIASVGLRVVRGRDWISEDQDGGSGNIGSITKVIGSDNTARVLVRWDFVGASAGWRSEVKCRAGASNKYDLYVATNQQPEAPATPNPGDEAEAVSKFLKKGSRVQAMQANSFNQPIVRGGVVVNVNPDSAIVKLESVKRGGNGGGLGNPGNNLPGEEKPVEFQLLFLEQDWTTRQRIAYGCSERCKECRMLAYLPAIGFFVGAFHFFIHAKQVSCLF
jgi:hypothetical protein